MKKSLLIALAALVLIWSPPAASASLIYDATIKVDGQGLGAVQTLVTAHQNDLESGCVAWSGVVDIFGPNACPAGITGGNEIANGPGGTYTLADLGITNWGDIAVIFNVSETGQDLSADLDQLKVSLYDSLGNVVYVFDLDRSSCLNAACSFTSGTGTGLGGAGFVFVLDAEQRAIAAGLDAVRVGGAFTASNTNDGNETLQIFGLPQTQVPEPATMLLLGTGLLGLGVATRRRRR